MQEMVERVRDEESPDAVILLSPGFCWGTTVLPWQAIKIEHVMNQTYLTYPEIYLSEMSGENIRLILEDVDLRRGSAGICRSDDLQGRTVPNH